MNNLHKKIQTNLELFEKAYKAFIVIGIVIFSYLVSDMFLRSNRSIKFNDDKVKAVNKVIDKLRMQLEPNKLDFHYITSDYGIWDTEKDLIDLYDVKINSTLGIAHSETLTIKNNNSLFEFRGKPVFTLYLKGEGNNN